MLTDLLTQDMIQVSAQEMDWQEAIKQCATPLLTNGAIEARYVTAMIAKVEEFGPFINIGPQIAMPHARPDEGVNHLGMSLLKLDHQVELLDDPKHPVSLFICLAAVDNKAHLAALSCLAKLLAKKEIVTRIMQAKTPAQIAKIIQEGEEK